MTVDRQYRLDSELRAAALHNLPERLAALLAQGADINAEREPGVTPLMLAVRNANWKTAQWLLDHGADIMPGNLRSHSAFREALSKLHESGSEVEAVIDKMVAMGADVNEADKDDWRALHLAVMTGRFSLAERLHLAGADINRLSPMDETGLMCVAENAADKETAILWMLEHGAEIGQKNRRGLTVLDFISDDKTLRFLTDQFRKNEAARKAAVKSAFKGTGQPLNPQKLRIKKPRGPQ